jgi:heme oxygenase
MSDVVEVRYVMNGTTQNDRYFGEVRELQVDEDFGSVHLRDGRDEHGPVRWAGYAPNLRIIRRPVEEG